MQQELCSSSVHKPAICWWILVTLLFRAAVPASWWSAGLHMNQLLIYMKPDLRQMNEVITPSYLLHDFSFRVCACSMMSALFFTVLNVILRASPTSHYQIVFFFSFFGRRGERTLESTNVNMMYQWHYYYSQLVSESFMANTNSVILCFVLSILTAPFLSSSSACLFSFLDFTIWG